MNPLDLLVGLRQADYADTLGEVEGKADLILMSPPYPGVARTYGEAEGKDWTLEDYQRLGNSVKRALRPDGGQCLCVLDGPVRDYRGDGYTERSVMPWRVLLDWKDRLGLVCPDVLAYGKQTSPGAFPRGFKSAWEPMLWFSTPGDISVNSAAIAEKRTTTSNRTTVGGKGGQRRANGHGRRNRSSTSPVADYVLPSTLWAYGNVSKGGGGPTENENHPARFPYRLARDVVLCFSNPGDLVVDPFLGSGTSLVAALDHGRRFFGGDLLARDRRDEKGRPLPGHGDLWIDVAQQIAVDRYAQRILFEPPTAVAPPEQMTIEG